MSKKSASEHSFWWLVQKGETWVIQLTYLILVHILTSQQMQFQWHESYLKAFHALKNTGKAEQYHNVCCNNKACVA